MVRAFFVQSNFGLILGFPFLNHLLNWATI